MILCGFIPMSDLCHITHSHLIHCVLKMLIRAALKLISVCIVVICIDWFKSYSIRIKGVNVQSFVVFILRSNTGLLAWCLLPCMLKSKKKDMMSRTLAGGGICMGGKTLQPRESESRGETGKLWQSCTTEWEADDSAWSSCRPIHGSGVWLWWELPAISG